MKTLAILFAAMTAFAQQPTAQNLRIKADLVTPISTSTAKQNDAVGLQVTEDVKGSNKSVVIPKDAKLTGHIAFVQKRGGDAKQAAVSLVVDKAEWKDGSLTLQAQVVTIESFGVDLMGQRISNPEQPTDKPGLEQPPWVTAGRAGNSVQRNKLPVPKDCGLEQDEQIGSVIVCDQQQVQLNAGARVTLKQGK